MKSVKEYRGFIIPESYLKILRLGCYNYTTNNITENTNTLDVNPDTDFYDVSRVIFSYTNKLANDYEHLNYDVKQFAELLFMDDKEAIGVYKEYQKMIVSINQAKINMRLNGNTEEFISAYSKFYTRVMQDFIYKNRVEYKNDGIYTILKPMIHGVSNSVDFYKKEGSDERMYIIPFPEKKLKMVDNICDMKTLENINSNLETLSIVQSKDKVKSKKVDKIVQI